MRRREFITLLGGAAVAWPLAARAQQQAKLPTIGLWGPSTLSAASQRVARFVQRLRELGWIEGRTVTIEYRWAEGRNERAAEIAAEFVRLKIDVIVAQGTPSVIAAKQATSVIPIVFAAVGDPVDSGLVASLSRPGGNVTGLSTQQTDTATKRIELFREMLPAAVPVAVLANPANATSMQTTLREVEAAGRAMGLQTQVFNAATSREIDAAFAAFARERPDALFVAQDAFFNGRRLQLANWAARHALPMTSGSRDICEVGGLMSYGTNIVDTYRQQGVYTGRILKGAKPADLPVEQSAKFELVINAQTARMFGLEIPPNLLARADEVIE